MGHGADWSGCGSDEARKACARLFRRTLASWASDALELRRRGLDRPSVRWSERPARPLRRAA